MENIEYKVLFVLWSLPTAFITCGALVWTSEWLRASGDLANLLSFMMMCILGFGALIFLTIDALIFGKARK